MGVIVLFPVRRMLRGPRGVITLSVIEKRVRYAPEPLWVIVRVGAPPDNLVPEVLLPEHRIHQNLQIMTRRRIAMQVYRTRRFQHPVQLHQPRGHHHQIRHHGVAANELPERGYHLLHRRRHRRAHDDILLVSPLRLLRPLPRIRERLDLRWRLLPRPLLEQHVIAGIGIERRVQIHQVHRLIRHILPQHRQVVPIIKRVGQPAVSCHNPLIIPPPPPSFVLSPPKDSHDTNPLTTTAPAFYSTLVARTNGRPPRPIAP